MKPAPHVRMQCKEGGSQVTHTGNDTDKPIQIAQDASTGMI